jgi:hypothetical protein
LANVWHAKLYFLPSITANAEMSGPLRIPRAVRTTIYVEIIFFTVIPSPVPY